MHLLDHQGGVPVVLFLCKVRYLQLGSMGAAAQSCCQFAGPTHDCFGDFPAILA